MIISREYFEIRRNAQNGCLESLLELADIYSQGLWNVEINYDLYLNTLIKVLNQIDDLRNSKFSSSLVTYEVMYLYLKQENTILAGHYLHNLAWELVWDYPNGNLEPYIEKYQIREIAECLGIEIEDTIDKVKRFQVAFEPSKYNIVGINHFFTNS